MHHMISYDILYIPDGTIWYTLWYEDYVRHVEYVIKSQNGRRTAINSGCCLIYLECYLEETALWSNFAQRQHMWGATCVSIWVFVMNWGGPAHLWERGLGISPLCQLTLCRPSLGEGIRNITALSTDLIICCRFTIQIFTPCRLGTIFNVLFSFKCPPVPLVLTWV